MADHDHPIEAEDIEALTEGLLADLDKEATAIDSRAAEAKRVLVECDSQRLALTQKRDTVLQAKAMQIAYLSKQQSPPASALPPLPPLPYAPPLPPTIGVGVGGPAQGGVNRMGHPGPGPVPLLPPQSYPWDRSKTRARIGPQRYLILIDVQQNGPTTAEEIATRTELPIKRVKDQIRSDINDGVLDEVIVQTGEPIGGTSKVRLSNFGGDLLGRFIAYRKNNNMVLPTKADALHLHEAEGVFS
jgi:hypothetical protein